MAAAVTVVIAVTLLLSYIPCGSSLKPQQGTQEMFMSFYGTDVTLQTPDWFNLPVVVEAADADEYFIRSNGSVSSLLRMDSDGIIERSKGLLPGWESRLTAFATNSVLPRLSNHTARGVFLGDELCCENSTCLSTAIAPITATLRSLLGSTALLYTNACAGTISGMAEGQMVPPDLDLISFDLYKGYGPSGGGAAEAAAVHKLATTVLYPRLSPTQRFMAVPGVFACSNTSYVPVSVSDASVSSKLQAYASAFANDPHFAGLNPWHFNNRSSAQHPSPCDMRLGAVALPQSMAVLRSIGQSYVRS